jgi:hypothetical protein
MTTTHPVVVLLDEYRRALDYTEALWADLPAHEIAWRPVDEFSPIGWHLGHQAAVAHFIIRNLTAAEPSPDPDLDGLMDSATPETMRDALPTIERLRAYRTAVAERVAFRATQIAEGRVGAPSQLGVIATNLLVSVVNHEYQHSQWISEVRHRHLGYALASRPTSPRLVELDGYLVLNLSI